ncbi:ModD protein [Skermanella pratensis]|uniref:ModD protein n=1 Tax=Skermanella pratensis TaxID=2233999 RepID=UPI0031B635AD
MMLPIGDGVLDALLAQDAPAGDLTTHALGIGSRPGRIGFAARSDMVLCCAEEAARLLERAGVRASLRHGSGERIAAGTVFLEGEGPAGGIHLAWKVAQTLVEHASGIATRTRRIVEAARAAAPGVAVACTRKNFPGTKEISVKAVLAGGAQMHRLGLSETLLVFPEHRVFLDGAADFHDLKRRHPERKLVVEVASVADAVAVAEAGADVLQLEKLAPDAVAEAVRRVAGLNPVPLVAAAGGITEANAAAYAATGCAVLVTSAPYFAGPADVQVVITRSGDAS